MTELLEGIGHNIRQLRDAKGWNQTELGFRADTSPSIISLIENGKRNPSTATLAKIAGALGVEVVDLFPKGRSSSLEPKLFNGLQDERREDTEYVHFDTALDRIGAAGNAAQEVVAEWRDESTRMLNEGRPPAKHRALEMRSFQNELAVIYTSTLADILKAAKEGSISVGYSSDDPQNLAEDPSLWPRPLRKYIHDAGSRIAVLPAVIEDLEREWAARGFESASLATQRGAVVEGSLPDEITRDAGWQDAIERAREEVGIR